MAYLLELVACVLWPAMIWLYVITSAVGLRMRPNRLLNWWLGLVIVYWRSPVRTLNICWCGFANLPLGGVALLLGVLLPSDVLPSTVVLNCPLKLSLFPVTRLVPLVLDHHDGLVLLWVD